jgi:hypothetical protein
MLIKFSKINRKLLILIIFPIFEPIRKIVAEHLEDKHNDNNFFKIFRFYLSYVLSIIFILIIKYRIKDEKKNIFNTLKNNINQKKEKKSVENSDIMKNNGQSWINPQDKVRNDLKKVKRTKKIMSIGILIVILLILNIFNLMYRDKYSGYGWNNVFHIGKQSIGVFFEIIFFIILSMVIMKNKIYRHHFVSLVVILLNLILLIISFIICFPDCIIQIFIYYYFYSFLFCLFCILGKRYLNLYFNSPYKIMLFIGIISLIIIFIFDIIMFSIFDNNDEHINKYGIIFGFKNMTNFISIFAFIFDVIFHFFSNIGIWMTIYYYTPFHYIISESISEYLFILYDFILFGRGYKVSDIILYTIIYIINLIFFLVFNEIIILNICGLNYNVKEKIEEREIIDNILALQTLESSYYTNNSIISDDKDN